MVKFKSLRLMKDAGAGRKDGRDPAPGRNWIAGLAMVLVSGLLFSLCGCSGPEAGNGKQETSVIRFQGDGPIQVTVTTGMVADLVRAVGGERVQVRQLLGPGIDPHLYKVSRDDVSEISKADLVVYSGLMLEGKMEDTFHKLAASRPVWAVTDGVSKTDLIQPGEGESHPDPHVWMDVSLWGKCLQDFARRMGEFDPDHRAEYEKNAELALARWQELHAEGERLLATIPPANRVLLTSHDAFGYFGRAYGIEVRGVQGISTESEAGLQQINQLVDLLVERRLQAVFVESSVPRKSIEAVVAGAASRGQVVEVAGPLYADAMGEPGTPVGTYEGMMRHNFELITSSLGGVSGR